MRFGGRIMASECSSGRGVENDVLGQSRAVEPNHHQDYHFDNPQGSSSGLAFPTNERTSSPIILSFLPAIATNYAKQKEEELSSKIINHYHPRPPLDLKIFVLDLQKLY